MGYNQFTLQQIIEMAVYISEAFIFLVMVLYLVFAFVLIRRLKIMNINFNTPHSTLFTIVAKLHFIIALIITVLTFLTLRR